MGQSSWQARLSAKLNGIAQKLIDNQITLTGIATDVILIKRNDNKMWDAQTLTIQDIQIVNMVFPSKAFTDVPIRRFYDPTTGAFFSANDSATTDTAEYPIECYAPVGCQINDGSVILKFFENNPTPDTITGSTIPINPWILPLQVKEVLGTFGSRKMVWQKIGIAYYDNVLPAQIMSYCTTMAQRRNILGW